MANSKFLCRQCRDYFPAADKKKHMGFCTEKCKHDFAIKELKKVINKRLEKVKAAAMKRVDERHKVFQRKFRQSDIRTRKQAAKKACHDYIKVRDNGLPCICCNRPLNGKIDAGHWLESGNNSKLRYHEDNIHSQSVYCNRYKGGDSDDYGGNLRKKIGDKRVDWLLDNKGGVVKRRAEDYKEIEVYYKQKLKELNKL